MVNTDEADLKNEQKDVRQHSRLRRLGSHIADLFRSGLGYETKRGIREATELERVVTTRATGATIRNRVLSKLDEIDNRLNVEKMSAEEYPRKRPNAFHSRSSTSRETVATVADGHSQKSKRDTIDAVISLYGDSSSNKNNELHETDPVSRDSRSSTSRETVAIVADGHSQKSKRDTIDAVISLYGDTSSNKNNELHETDPASRVSHRPSLDHRERPRSTTIAD